MKERQRQIEELYHAALERAPDERAAALTGDTAQRRQGYTDFLAVWQAADADLPILREAKQEYAYAAKR